MLYLLTCKVSRYCLLALHSSIAQQYRLDYHFNGYYAYYFVLQLGSTDALDQENFFDLLSRTQSRRIDDQRCSFRGLNEHRNGRPDENKENTGPKSGTYFLGLPRLP